MVPWVAKLSELGSFPGQLEARRQHRQCFAADRGSRTDFLTTHFPNPSRLYSASVLVLGASGGGGRGGGGDHCQGFRIAGRRLACQLLANLIIITC